MTPYYEHGGIAIYHGDCRNVLVELLDREVIVTDPPYGVGFKSGRDGAFGESIVRGDDTTAARDWLVHHYHRRPMAVFGSPRVDRPAGLRAVLVWDKGEHVGMGDLTLPWKPTHEEIYIYGDGWRGHRGGSVLRYLAIAGTVAVTKGRSHETEKPEGLMIELISKAPPGEITDPFMGSGTTLVAAKRLGRSAIGIEIEERYCEIAAQRLSQEALPLEVA